jgi:hypothetical protein
MLFQEAAIPKIGDGVALDHVVPDALAKTDKGGGTKRGSVGHGKQAAGTSSSRSNPSGSENREDSETPSGSGGSSGEGVGRGGGGGGDGPGDHRRPEKNDSSEDEEEEEEEEEEDVNEDDNEEDNGDNVDGNDGRDADEEVAVAAQAVAGSSNPGSPSAEGNNWHSYETLMTETYPAKSKALYLEAYSNFEKFLKREKQFVPNVAPSELSLLNYFSYLRKIKKWVATTIWSQYSRLNAVLKRKFGLSLNTIPNITDLLKSYSSCHRLKKSSVFTPQQASWLSIVLSC